VTGLLDRVKRETTKATFEADRLLRIRRVEGAIGQLQRQITQQAYQIGHKAIELYKNGRLDSPTELTAMCGQVQQLEQEIAEKEAEIERIRQEVPPVPPEPTPGPAIARQALYGYICPSCQIELPTEAVFCPRCGGRAEDVQPPADFDAYSVCALCGAALPQEARFCPACGNALDEQRTSDSAGPTPMDG
jgi:ribosomal protein L40E